MDCGSEEPACVMAQGYVRDPGAVVTVTSRLSSMSATAANEITYNKAVSEILSKIEK